MAICAYCGCESSPFLTSKDYNRRITNHTFQHYRCSNCGLIFIDPKPNDLAEYYPESYHFVPDSPEAVDASSAPEQYKIEIVLQHCRRGRLLEIGPAYGSFTYLAKKAGFDVEAIEMSERCCKFLSEVIGVHAINSRDPIRALADTSPYDVIALWHVIEHLPNPWHALQAICAKLKPSGILVLAAPNPQSLQFRLMGRFWPHLDAPRHLTLIPMSLLENKMKALGLGLELATTTDPGSLGWNTFGWEYFFSNLTASYQAKRGMRVIGRLTSRLFAPLERRQGKGSAYTVIFRKRG